MSSLIHIMMGYFELGIPHGRILESPHPQFSQLFLPIEPYKYKLMSIEVLLCYWIHHLAQVIGEHREQI